MQSKDTRGKLGEKFEGFGAAPTEQLWGKIADSFDEDKKRRGFIWWWIGGGIAAACIAIVLFNLPSDNENKRTIPIANIEKNTDKNEPIIKDDSIHPVHDNEEIVQKENIHNSAEEKNEMTENNSNLNTIIYDEETVSNQEKSNEYKRDEVDEEAQMTNKKEKDIVENQKQKKVNKIDRSTIKKLAKTPITSIPLSQAKLNLVELNQPKEKKPWEVGFNMAYYNDVRLTAKSASLSSFNDPVETVGIANSTQTVSNYTVNRYINVQGFIGKYFTKRFAWRTGLYFSRATYKTEYSASSLMQTNTAISSVEIPLQLRLDILQKKGVNIKLFTGIHNEFAIFQKYRANYDGNYSLMEESPVRKFTTGYSVGIESGLAIDIKLNNRLALTVNPSYRYYFMQNAKTEFPIVEKRHWYGGSLGLVWRLGR